MAVLAAGCGTRVPRALDARTASGAATANTVAATATPGAVPSPSDAGAVGGSQSGGTGATGQSGPAASAGSAAAGSVGATVPTPTGSTIVLGGVGTRSGILGAALENSWRGIAVWERWVNANGGIGGHPVRVITTDDGGDPAKHRAAVQKQILDDRVSAFIADIAPLTFSAGIPVIEQYGIPAIGGESADGGWFASPMAFPINGQSIARSRPAAKWLLGHLAERKAAVFYVNEADASKRLAANFEDQWKASGGQVVVSSGVSLATPDFTAEVIRAKNAGADINFLVLEFSACNRYFDAMRRQHYTPIIVGTACNLDNAIGAKDFTVNRLYTTSASRYASGDSPAEREARAAIARFDPTLEPDGGFMFTWLAGKLLEAALASNGYDSRPAAIVNTLHKLAKTDLGGLTPAQTWPPGPHAEGRCGLVSRFDGTKMVLQTPQFVC